MLVRRRIPAIAQARRDEVEKMPVEFGLGNALPARVLLAHAVFVRAHSLRQCLRGCNAPQRHAELAQQPCNFCNVMVNDKVPRHSKRVTRAACGHERIPVAVAPNPRTETQELRKVRLARTGSIHLSDRLFQFGIEPWHGFKQHHREIIEAHVDFVADGGLLEPDFVGLPKGGNFGQDLRFRLKRVSLGERNLVQTLEQPSNVPPFQPDGMPRDLGRMRRKYGRHMNPA